MNSRLKSLIVNSGYAIFSNMLSMLISALVVLILPKIIGVTSYGYWQLYLFYVSYVGFFHFGWIDGIYLKYGGQHYEHLDKNKFFSQFVSYTIFQIVLSFFVASYARFFITNVEKTFIWYMLAITLFLTNLRFFIVYILQTTNRIKESSRVLIFDRLIYICLLLSLLLFGQRNYQMMIWADIIGRLMSLMYGIYLCRSIIWNKFSLFKLNVSEIFDNIKAGSNLMFSNIASMLIIGTVRMGIERTWDVATFGKVSLTLSISNLMMTFINAIGIVIFPMIKRMKEKYIPLIYKALRDYLMVLMLGVMLLYYPLRFFLNGWLPAYNDSLKYMALVFPMSIFEGKMSLLINTYLKALRMERVILGVNVLTMLCSFALTILTTIVFKNIELAIGSIVFLLMFRCFLAEFLLTKRLKIEIVKDVFLEIAMALIFIVTGWTLSILLGFLIYFFSYGLYLFYKSSSIKKATTNIKTILKES